MPVPEDTFLNRIPYTLTHALKGELDPGDKWKQLFIAVESSQDDGPPLDPDFKEHLELCNQRKESPTEKLLSDLGTKGYRVYHLRKWLRAEGLLRAASLLEGGDRRTGRLPGQKSYSASSKSWVYESQPEYRHSQSAEGRGGTIQLPSDQMTTYGNAEGGGGGGTIELDGNVLTGFESTKEPEVGSSKSEATSVVAPNKCVDERPDDPEVAGGGVGGPSESESADGVEKSNRSELPSAAEGWNEPEGVSAIERLNKSEDADVMKEPKEVKNATAIESISRVNFSDLTKPAEQRMRTEKAQPDTHSVVPSENRTPYQKHHLVGSETVRRRETLANSTGVGSSPKEEVDTSVPEPLPLAPPSSPNGVNKCTIYLILLVAAILWVATLGVALYALK